MFMSMMLNSAIGARQALPKAISVAMKKIRGLISYMKAKLRHSQWKKLSKKLSIGVPSDMRKLSLASRASLEVKLGRGCSPRAAENETV